MNQFRKLSIIIPVFNEERTLSQLISAVENVPLQMDKEIILVDDCSTDGSRKILESLNNKANGSTVAVVEPCGGFSVDKRLTKSFIHKIVLLDKNQGKGATVRRGFQEATGDIVLIQDADLEYDPNDYPELIKPIVKGEADVVYGSRFLRSERSQNNTIIYKHGYIFSRVINLVSNVLSGTRFSDMYTCYKVFSKKAIEQVHSRLTAKRFGIDPELTAWVGKLNFRIIEVPISYKGRTYEEGKKINWKDGIAAIFHIIRYNLFTRK